ncbi:hypothetical protein GIB67_025406 [Kingdonia uniflora]|uniref:Uncharacterized protein n=1 Tax=Kingdonia uniflora TaxID=39325 RepID=A0A7J7NC44_9MAGN|nr:hypothetical protein GIB67_025406 [Kingdonia uniflora]
MCAKTYPSNTSLAGGTKCMPQWFIAIYTRNRGFYFYAYNPIRNRWHAVPMGQFLPEPIVSIGSFILCRVAASSPLQLSLCNPFTKQYQFLPQLQTLRTNPAVGVVTYGDGTFKVNVAGGMSQGPKGGNAFYEPTLEMYESRVDKCKSLGRIPIEFAVRLTVWTQNDSVYYMGVLYWITSARAYNVMGYEVESGEWKELKIPMSDKLEFAALVRRKGRLVLVGGGACIDGEAWIWELGRGYTGVC